MIDGVKHEVKHTDPSFAETYIATSICSVSGVKGQIDDTVSAGEHVRNELCDGTKCHTATLIPQVSSVAKIWQY